ncbi:MAG: HAD-IC family P-type ATPase [Actinomycetota bacterium]|nr:HAD-IC family P-type ATPase [Actinomycetota bacterium]
MEVVHGLTAAEVAERVAAGQINDLPNVNSRSISDIIKANTLTWFNGLIGAMWIVMLLIAPIQDSLFGFVIVANTAIGIIQEFRAARALAKLAVIGEAKPVVRRDGTDVPVSANEVVLDDVIVLTTGDQLVVDGEVLVADGLEIDESLLTGEADPVDMKIGDQVMSGSFVVAGSGLYRATRVGRDSFAAGLTEQAKKFHQTNSELRDSINRFIRLLSYLLLPVGLLLFFSQWLRADLPINEVLRGTIAGMVTMVPEGLVLLTSIAMAVAVIRLAAKKVLVQDLPAVEVLARVDTICVDKTGTLTEPGMQVRDVVSLVDEAATSAALGALAAVESSPNLTLQAVGARYPNPAWLVQQSVPFSSARKWSAATFAGHGTWVIGAPEMLLADGDPVRARADTIAGDGARVLLLAKGADAPDAESGPGQVTPVALVVIDQTLRPDAAETVAYFLEQDVRVKVISGDNAATVGAIAAQAGVPGAENPIDARTLPQDTVEVAKVLETASVFGRVTPLQKQSMVDALHLQGCTVAMTGDGVNDVLALKNADLGIAMGSGSGATRAVAQLVLLDDKWAVMPSVVAEGRRVLGNIERVADVFLTKSFYAIFISIATGVFAVAFPFLPRHISLIGALTIGIPGFFLALMPNTERFRPGFFKRVLIFTAPAGAVAALAAFTSYGIALNVGETLGDAQSAATVTLFIVTTAVLIQSARPLSLLRLGIVALMIVLFLGVLFIPFFSNFFALSLDPERYSLVAIAVGLVGACGVWVIAASTDRWRRA